MAISGKILVTGSRGQLGTDLITLLGQSYSVVGYDLPELDITQKQQVGDIFLEEQPAVVIHAAALTNVDVCETEREAALAVNAEGTRNVAEACCEGGARMIYYSTDYVFDGEKESPYTEEDEPSPRTVYGQSKLAGERAVQETLEDYAILRIGWVYGRHGGNFVKTMISLGKSRVEAQESGRPVDPLTVVNDQRGNPTWTVEIVGQTEALLSSEYRGLFHATSEGEATWYELTKALFAALAWPVEVVPCTTEEFPRPAPRPKNSVLSNDRLNGAGRNLMRPWQTALEEFIRLNQEDLTR